jgi:peptidoglycan LD-endopeptidase LytH
VLRGSCRRRWAAGVVVGAVVLVELVAPGGSDPGSAARWSFGSRSPAGAAEAGEAADPVTPAPDPAAARRRAAEEAVADARAHRRAAERALAQRAEATERAQRAALAVDPGVRTAEERIVTAVVARWEAGIALEQALAEADQAAAALRRHRAALVALRQEDRLVRRALAEARTRLDERTIRAYKHGSVAASTGWMLGAAREASSPGDLAAATKHLERLSEDGFADVELLEAVHGGVQSDLARATVRRHLAVLERDRTIGVVEEARAGHERASEAVVQAEVAAAARRADDDRAEARRLAVWQRALEAEAAAANRLEELRHRESVARRALEVTVTARTPDPDPDPDARRPRPETGPPATTDEGAPGAPAASDAGGPADGDDEDGEGSLEDRRQWLRSRHRALERGRALGDDARRADDAWVCPVADGRFVNDWGFPRSQLRRHQGTDVFAPQGTPVVSPVAGVVAALDTVDRFDGRRGFGGITVTIERGNERFYHAHLERIAAGLRIGDAVVAGSPLGAVGRTGNARGTPPHLHFGWYVDDVAVNPYASLALACGPWPRPEDIPGERPPA